MNSDLPTSSPTGLAEMLQQPRALPRDPIAEQIVLWHTFRSLSDALAFADVIQLGDGQQLVGGTTQDSVGAIHWLGVHVDDLAKWGNTKAIQMSDAFDPESPSVQGRPFTGHTTK